MAFKSFVNLIKWVGRFLIDGSIGLIEQSSAPGTPPLNQLTVYAKEAADGTTQLYYKDSEGIEHDLSSGLTAILLSQVYGKRDVLKVREPDLFLVDNTRANVSTSKHGLTPKLPNDASKFLDGTGAYSKPKGDYLVAQIFSRPPDKKVTEHDIKLRDTTTGDVTTSRHGFIVKAPNDPTKFFRGDATWASPGPQTDHLVARIFQQVQRLIVRENDLVFIDSTKNNASTSKHGLLQKLPGGTTDFLRADGSFAAPTSSPDVLVVQVFS